MPILVGTIVFRKRGTKGFWYNLFSPNEGITEMFSRHDALLLFDRIEASVICRGETFLLVEWTIIERSPLAEHPEHLTVAGYLAHLIACFTEAGPSENTFIEASRSLLASPFSPACLLHAEKVWGEAMGLRVERPDDLDTHIRLHSANGYRIRRHLLGKNEHSGRIHA